MSTNETTDKMSGGEVIVGILEQFGVKTVFGVISIHNVPILEAIDKRRTMQFIQARGEQGACNMADGYCRIHGGLGVFVTSTGPGAGNAAGAMTEALSSGIPLLHLTGQIDSPFVDKGQAHNHETADQLGMLQAVSKAAFRVRSPAELARVITQACTIALTAPMGPVSVEIPIDFQKNPAPFPDYVPMNGKTHVITDPTGIVRLAAMLNSARRPLIWAGGGALHSGPALQRLLDRGVGLVTSVHGRAVVPEDHAMTLGALNNGKASEAFYRTCDLVIIAGSKLRGNETKLHKLGLPKRLAQIDVDLKAWDRNYTSDLFVLGDCADVLAKLEDALPSEWKPDPAFAFDIAKAKKAAAEEMRAAVGPYAEISDMLREAMPRDAVFVRDVTISTNTWGNRLFEMYAVDASVSALGGGIGQGLQQAIGACFAAGGRKTVALIGDGGFALNIGELFTAKQENVDLLILLMNDGGYGVIKNIVEANYGKGRDFYSDLYLPDMVEYSRTVGLEHWRASTLNEFKALIGEAMSATGPRILEVDMHGIGDFPEAFAGPKIK